MSEPTFEDEMECSNYFEQIDLAALEEAEAILNGDLPSSPETYRMVEKWFGKSSASNPATSNRSSAPRIDEGPYGVSI